MKFIYTSAAQLPPDWDAATGDNPYIKRGFLEFLSRVQETPLTFYVFRGAAGNIDSYFVMHKARFNLYMFTDSRNKIIDCNTVYVPLSISRPAINLGVETKGEAEAALCSFKGWSAVINAEGDAPISGFSYGNTCPRCTLNIKWKSLSCYLAAMRSNYRYRYAKALKKSAPLKIRILEDNRDFSDTLYGQYLQVFANSRIQIETLKPAFFRDPRFVTLVAESENGEEGFLQMLSNGSELIFEFTGFEHSNNARYDTYHRLLLELVRYGIENGFSTIDFGQTADDAKLKLGCGYTYLYTHLRHSNPVINYFIGKRIKKIQYKCGDPSMFTVFKKEGEKE